MPTFRLPFWFIRRNSQWIKRHFSAAYSRYQNSARFRAWWVGSTMTKPLVLMPAIATVKAYGFGGKTINKKEIRVKDNNDVIDKADLLYAQLETDDLYNLLIPHKHSDNDEILWRLARAAYDKSKIVENTEERKRLIVEAFHYAERALEVNAENFACHKLYSTTLDEKMKSEKPKERLHAAIEIKDHLVKATELNPEDATTVYSIGLWYFSFADLAWYQRKICSVVFEDPPQATYEQALEYFERAEQIDPGFYSKNTLMIGTIYARLQQKDKAIPYLKKVLQFPLKTLDDKEAHKEATQLLRSLGEKV